MLYHRLETLGTWFSGHGGDGLKVGLNDFRVFFPTSMILWLQEGDNPRRVSYVVQGQRKRWHM